MDAFPKHLFLTGATGFVGKAVLEKVIRSFPDDVITYLLIRQKKGTRIEDRLEKEIFASPIFTRVREERGMKDDKVFFRYMHTRVVAVQGDVSIKGLGISEDVLNKVLIPRITVAIHCAASVDFDERLDLAIGNNITGALETLRVCSLFPNLKRYVHVSTAYVSVNQTHRKKILEEVPKLDFDYEGLIKQALSLKTDLPALEAFTQKVLAQTNFPNTYTITKAIAEVMIDKQFSGNKKFTIHICRPSIVGAAWIEPVPGWVDSVSAASAVFLAGALGIVTLLPGDPLGVADIIPVDIIANHILVACVAEQSNSIRVSHCCTSCENPVRWRVLHDSVQRSFLKIGLPRARPNIGSREGFKMIADPRLFQLEWTFCYDVPTMILRTVAAITRNPAHQKLARLMTMLNERAGKVADLFSPFTTHEYFFSTDTSINVWMEDRKNTKEKTTAAQYDLNIDVKDIAWAQYFFNYVYGLLRFILHEELIPVTATTVSHNDLKLNSDRLVHWDADHHLISFPGLLGDVTWAYTQSRAPGYTKSGGLLGRALGLTGWREGLNHEARHVARKTIRTATEMEVLVLASEGVRRAMRAEVAKMMKQSGGGKKTKRTVNGVEKDIFPERQFRLTVRKRTESIYRKLVSSLEDQPPRAFGWFLRKIWRSMFDGIQVDELGIDRVRSLLVANSDVASRKPVVLVPSHRSYIDFLVLSYVMFAYNIPVPHIAASEDFLNMGPVSNLLRQSGAFFIKRDGNDDTLYREIMKEYLFRLLEDGQTIEFFLEGTRSRSGKSLQPKTGMLKLMQDAIMGKRVEDVLLVPISISYERPLEVSLYAEEMLGSSKPRETLMNLLRGAAALGKRFGNIFLQFADPVSLKALSTSTSGPSPAIRLIHAIDFSSISFTTHLVATLLLMYRNGATFEQLLRGLAFMRQEMYKRGARVIGVEGMRPEDTLTRALTVIGPIIAKRDVPAVYQVDWSSRNWTNFLALAYYRNHIIHLFCGEAIWAAAIHARSKEMNAGAAAASSKQPAVVFGKDGKPKLVQSDGGISTPKSHQELKVCASQEELRLDVAFLQAMLGREFVSHSPEKEALADLERRGVVELDHANRTVTVKEARTFALLCSMIWPFIDGYFVAAMSLYALLNGNAVPLQEFNSRMMALAETLFQDGVVLHYECCSSGTLMNALETFHEWEIVKYTKVALPRNPMQPETFKTEVSLSAGYDSREALRSLVNKVDKLRRKGHRQFSVDEAGTPMGAAHFPALARM